MPASRSSPPPRPSKRTASSDLDKGPFACLLGERLPPSSSLALSSWGRRLTPPTRRPRGDAGARGAARSPPPSPAAITAADQLLTAMGVKETIAKTVPTMMTELEQQRHQDAPGDPGQPEADAGRDQTRVRQFGEADLRKGRGALALAMSEKELEDVAAFFTSPTGKNFLAIQPIFLQRLQDVLDPWRQDCRPTSSRRRARR